MVYVFGTPLTILQNNPSLAVPGMKTFSSIDELKNFLTTNSQGGSTILVADLWTQSFSVHRTASDVCASTAGCGNWLNHGFRKYMFYGLLLIQPLTFKLQESTKPTRKNRRTIHLHHLKLSKQWLLLLLRILPRKQTKPLHFEALTRKTLKSSPKYPSTITLNQRAYSSARTAVNLSCWQVNTRCTVMAVELSRFKNAASTNI